MAIETLYVHAEHCALAGRPYPMSRFEASPESDDFTEVELTPESADWFDSQHSCFGWRVAALIRERLGIRDDEYDNEDD